MAGCVQIDLGPTFGIQFWGLLVSIFFLGAALVQAHLYYMNNSDGWFMRGFVALILALDVAGTILMSEAMHFYLIASFGNPFGLVQMTQTYIAEIVLALVTVLMSQHFYAGRVLVAGGNNVYARIAAAIIFIVSIASFGSALAACVKLYLTGRAFTSLEQPSLKSMISAWSFSNGLCDAIATFSMCYFLTSYKSSFKSTTSVVNSLFLFSINRGFLVFVTQIGLVSAYLAAPSKGYWAPFHLILPKLHVNTLLAMLNSRSYLRNRMEGRVNVIEGSCSGNSSRHLTPTKWQTGVTTGQSTVSDTKSDNKIGTDAPEHNGVRITRSFMTFTDDDRHGGTSGNEVSDCIKGHSIA